MDSCVKFSDIKIDDLSKVSWGPDVKVNIIDEADNLLMLVDGEIFLVYLENKKRCIRFVTPFAIQEGNSSKAIDFCNKFNEQYVLLRASVLNNKVLQFDHYLFYPQDDIVSFAQLKVTYDLAIFIIREAMPEIDAIVKG